MLDLFGRRYVIDHCISAFRIQAEEKIYRVYVTDGLRALCGGQGDRYYDLITPGKEETRTAEEIIDNIKGKLNGCI